MIELVKEQDLEDYSGLLLLGQGDGVKAIKTAIKRAGGKLLSADSTRSLNDYIEKVSKYKHLFIVSDLLDIDPFFEDFLVALDIMQIKFNLFIYSSMPTGNSDYIGKVHVLPKKMPADKIALAIKMLLDSVNGFCQIAIDFSEFMTIISDRKMTWHLYSNKANALWNQQVTDYIKKCPQNKSVFVAFSGNISLINVGKVMDAIPETVNKQFSLSSNEFYEDEINVLVILYQG